MKNTICFAMLLAFLKQAAFSQNIGIGTTTPNSRLDINGDIALHNAIINITTTGNYALDANTIRQAGYRLIDTNITAVGNFFIAGITAGADGRQLTLYNRTGSSMEIYNEDAAAIAANRIKTGIGTTLAVYNGGSVQLRYDTSINRWEVISSHYNNLDYFGDTKWTTTGNDISNLNSGNVGIGTSGPLAKFDVNGDALVRYNVNVIGNVGIGTFNPADKLEVNGNVKLDNNLVVNNIATIGNSSAPYTLNVKSNSIGVSQESPDGSTKIGFYVQNGTAYLQTHTNHPLLFATNNGAEKMRLQTNGNFGIGTNNPNATLSVARGNGNDGTAAFFGTNNSSHFNYSTAEDTYIRGGKTSSKLILNDYGGQVTLGTTNAGNAQLNIVSSRTGTNANGLSINQATTNTGSDSYGLYTYADGSNQSNIGLKSEVGGSGSSVNYAGSFRAASSTAGSNYAIQSWAEGSQVRNYGGKFDALGGTISTQNQGIHVYSSGPGTNYGIYCDGWSSTNNGIPISAGIFATSSAGYGYAGWFAGNVWMTQNLNVVGYISKSGGSFQIDHPQDPANKYLYHSFVESPDMMNIYNGNIVTNTNNEATVELPGYFTVLNKDYRYQLTVIGQPAQVWIEKEISNNKFVVKSDKPNVKISWQVTGIRQDAWANAHRIVPEVEKEAQNKGKYLTPEVFAQPEEKGIHYVKPKQLNQTNR